MKDRTKPKEKAEPNQKPAYRFQCSNVTASVFPVEYKRDGVTHFSYNVVIDRSYRDGDEWKNTKTFRFSDLHKVITVAQKAFEVISMNQGRLDGQSPSTKRTRESRESEVV